MIFISLALFLLEATLIRSHWEEETFLLNSTHELFVDGIYTDSSSPFHTHIIYEIEGKHHENEIYHLAIDKNNKIVIN